MNWLTDVKQELRYKVTGKSYWVARYSGRDDVYEWHCDFSLLPRDGLIELRMICPNGQVAVLGNTVGAGDRLFQFKGGELRVGGPGSGRTTLYQIIGRLDGVNGECTCWAWEYTAKKLVGPFQDNWFHMNYGGPQTGKLNADVLGVRPD